MKRFFIMDGCKFVHAFSSEEARERFLLASQKAWGSYHAISAPEVMFMGQNIRLVNIAEMVFEDSHGSYEPEGYLGTVRPRPETVGLPVFE